MAATDRQTRRRAASAALQECAVEHRRVPIHRHYYEPQFDHRFPKRDYSEDRNLPGIDWNVSSQLELCRLLTFSSELADLPRKKTKSLEFHLDNGLFDSGDAEYRYNILRAVKPKTLIEVGSGFSTLMAAKAIARNRADDPSYRCAHICIEPFENPWLEDLGVTVIRSKVEDLDPTFFGQLGENDILFIDSSHMIRPQGDVLFEYLELLPSLRRGVIVHVHDIFSPKDYLRGWLADEVRFWNEQYLLEAFLTHNRDWKVIGALNYLQHHHFDTLKAVAPSLTPDREPGSFYLQRVA